MYNLLVHTYKDCSYSFNLIPCTFVLQSCVPRPFMLTFTNSHQRTEVFPFWEQLDFHSFGQAPNLGGPVVFYTEKLARENRKNLESSIMLVSIFYASFLFYFSLDFLLLAFFLPYFPNFSHYNVFFIFLRISLRIFHNPCKSVRQ